MVTRDRSLQIDGLVAVVTKGISECLFIDLKIESDVRRMFQANMTLKAQLHCWFGDLHDRNTIAEDVMDPADKPWSWIDNKRGLKKALVETVTRTKHQPMLTECHGPQVPIDG